jgi:hypothetical protein
MEIARLRAEVAVYVWSVTSQKKPRRTSRRTRCEVRLDTPNETAVPGERVMQGAGGQCQRVLQLGIVRQGQAHRPQRYSDEALLAHMRAIHAEVKQRIRLAAYAQRTAGP